MATYVTGGHGTVTHHVTHGRACIPRPVSQLKASPRHARHQLLRKNWRHYFRRGCGKRATLWKRNPRRSTRKTLSRRAISACAHYLKPVEPRRFGQWLVSKWTESFGDSLQCNCAICESAITKNVRSVLCDHSTNEVRQPVAQMEYFLFQRLLPRKPDKTSLPGQLIARTLQFTGCWDSSDGHIVDSFI